ncbi:hypothetical protein B566_EDAN018761 [Ephemera danica]|nr:hypothetical protein B566_EDAN018761 [Ephemera danica]
MIQAAAARNTIPVTLELGGKSPQIVFDDADLDAALPFLVNAGIQNAGQTCSAASRILVQRGVYEQVMARMAERYQQLRVGPAMGDLDVGPLHESAAPGGYYVRPTLFGPVEAGNRLAQEEIFGPVQVMIPFDDEPHALAIANGTAFGLVAGVWTKDGSRALRLAHKLKCGQVFINNYGAGGGVELPFGGVKASGHGREKRCTAFPL